MSSISESMPETQAPVFTRVRCIFLRRLLAWKSQRVLHWRSGKELSHQSRRKKAKMQPEDLQERWKEQGEQVFACLAQWRAGHPQARLAEIEQAGDEQINRLRARMIEQAAQASAAAENEASQGLVCEQCGQGLQARGRAKRRWQTHGGQQVEVERTYVTCPQCGGGFFPPG
jgi:YgiT-type zinc finger domain-containing protein